MKYVSGNRITDEFYSICYSSPRSGDVYLQIADSQGIALSEAFRLDKTGDALISAEPYLVADSESDSRCKVCVICYAMIGSKPNYELNILNISW